MSGWINIRERRPAREDANSGEYVLAALRNDRQNGFPNGIGLCKWYKISLVKFTYWMPLIDPPTRDAKEAEQEYLNQTK